MSVSDIGIGPLFIWFLISVYVNKGIEKVPTSSKIRVRVQGSTSEICNSPLAFDTIAGWVLDSGTDRTGMGP